MIKSEIALRLKRAMHDERLRLKAWKTAGTANPKARGGRMSKMNWSPTAPTKTARHEPRKIHASYYNSLAAGFMFGGYFVPLTALTATFASVPILEFAIALGTTGAIGLLSI
ncbi:hypothetical protein [Bradyrhizobium sp. B117]|uniref:hypothetical protein n=1 Tax=Bradyrhizobium sp. B117 TaxID=3140246 RepID=UPI003182F4D7